MFSDYLFSTFSSFSTFLAIIKTTNAIIMKFISSPRKAPQPSTIGPISIVAVLQAPPGIKGVMIGIIMLSTKDFIKAVDAIPIIKAIARGITFGTQ